MKLKGIAINILMKSHRTLIDLVLLLVAFFALTHFQDYLRGTRMLFLCIVILGALCDFFFTWIPTSVLSKDYRNQIKKVYFYSEATGDICLDEKETEELKAFMQKKADILRRRIIPLQTFSSNFL